MPLFGYDTGVGWIPATFPLVLTDLQERYQAETEVTADVENGPAADMLRTVAGLFTDMWQDAEGPYNAGFITAAPGTGGVAEGAPLEILLTDKIGPKLAEETTKVTVPLFAVAGPNVNIPGTAAIRLGTELALWTILAPVVIPGGGQIDADFELLPAGPRSVVAGSAWTIATPVTGWDSAGPNAADAITGRFEESDAEYRDRYRASLLDNLVKEVGKVVNTVSVVEWQFGIPDAFWGATHWVELLVTGGVDTEIADAIHRSRAKGVRSIGFTTVPVIDANYIGGQWEESFSRPVGVGAFVEVTVVKGQGYPADNSPSAVTAREDLMKAAVFQHFAGLSAGDNTSGFKIGSDVDAAVEPTIPGIVELKVKVDKIFPPVNTGEITATIREQLTITLPNIGIVGA